jgi:hypothetical protein
LRYVIIIGMNYFVDFQNFRTPISDIFDFFFSKRWAVTRSEAMKRLNFLALLTDDFVVSVFSLAYLPMKKVFRN